MEVGVLYVPFPMSHSADTFWLLNARGDSVHLQLKQGSIDYPTLKLEVQKVLLMSVKYACGAERGMGEKEGKWREGIEQKGIKDGKGKRMGAKVAKIQIGIACQNCCE